MKLLSDVAVLGTGFGSSVVLAGVENDLIKVLPNGFVAPLLLVCFTIIIYFVKQQYQSMTSSMARHSSRLDRIEFTLTEIDKQLAIIAERDRP